MRDRSQVFNLLTISGLLSAGVLTLALALPTGLVLAQAPAGAGEGAARDAARQDAGKRGASSPSGAPDRRAKGADSTDAKPGQSGGARDAKSAAAVKRDKGAKKAKGPRRSKAHGGGKPASSDPPVGSGQLADSSASTPAFASASLVAARSPARPAVAAGVAVGVAAQAAAPRPSMGETIGLKAVADPLSLHSSVALVMDSRNGEVLLRKNPGAVLPIASITKLMTAMVVIDAGLPLREKLQISREDIDKVRHTSSRLHPGAILSRAEMLQLALMSSENRAANALGRHYPGGMPAFVAAMNAKARALGMSESRFVEPTGLSSANVSNARDLARLVRAASDYALIREYSTARSLTVQVGQQPLGYYNTNRLVAGGGWSIGLQKTGYISEAGNCLVMQAMIGGRQTIFVLLDAAGKLARFGDAQRIRGWIEKTHANRPVAVRAAADALAPVQTVQVSLSED